MTKYLDGTADSSLLIGKHIGWVQQKPNKTIIRNKFLFALPKNYLEL